MWVSFVNKELVANENFKAVAWVAIHEKDNKNKNKNKKMRTSFYKKIAKGIFSEILRGTKSRRILSKAAMCRSALK